MKKKILLGMIAVLLSFTSLVLAEVPCPLERKDQPRKVSSLESFKSLSVLHDGRIKPLDTYARNILLQFSGKRSFNRKPAIEWLAALVFAPETTWDDKIFLINNPGIPMAIGIQVDQKRQYSFSQLQSGFEKITELARAASKVDDKDKSIVQHEVLRLYYNVLFYSNHTNLTSFAFPHPDFQISSKDLVSKLDLPKQTGFSFLDIALKASLLQKMMEGVDINQAETLTEEDRIPFRLLNNLYQWSTYFNDLPFTVIPNINKEDEVWLSPWDAINNEFYDDNIRTEARLWRDLTVYYWNGSQADFDTTASDLQSSVRSRLSKKEWKTVNQTSYEIFYNKGNFFLWAKLLYGFAFLVFLFSFLIPKPFLHSLAFSLVSFGFILNVIAQALRIAILMRAPVTNLFETFVFVGLTSVLIGIIIELKHKKWLGILVSSVCGFLFLMIAGKYAAEGDTMRMLMAVLNSNFWLATHVITISIGYAGCCVAGIIGHMYLIQYLSSSFKKKDLESTYRNLMGALNLGLMMTFLGTILGGIWADQSWGRFWGWDPKENGALLIIIWTAIILHAKAGRLIGSFGLAVGSILNVIVVMWAWFGVNLLNIGLHSYGFTSGVAKGLIGYALIEIIFLIGVFIKLKTSKNRR